MGSWYTRAVALTFLVFALSLACIADTIRISGQLYEDVLIQESKNFYDVYVPKTGEVLDISKQRTDFDQVQIDKDPAERKRLSDAWRETRDKNDKRPKDGWLSYKEKEALNAEARKKELDKQQEEWMQKVHRDQQAWNEEYKRRQEELRRKQQAENIAAQERPRQAEQEREKTEKLSREWDAARTVEEERPGRESRTHFSIAGFFIVLILVFVIGCVAALFVEAKGHKGCAVFLMLVWASFIMPTTADMLIGGCLDTGTHSSQVPRGSDLPESSTSGVEIGGTMTATTKCFGTSNKDGVAQALELVKAGQSEKFYGMVISGLIVEIPPGTSVTVVERGLQFIQIEVPGRGRVWTCAVWFH